MLGDIDEPTAPFGLVDVRGDGRRIAEAHDRLAPELAQALRRQARRLGVSPASLMHMAWAMVLARITGRDEVVFGTVLFGRMQAGANADRGLGLFINTLPVRIGVDGGGIADGVKATHARLIDLLRHEHAPLAVAQRASAVPADAPLFTSLLNYRYSVEAPAPQAAPGDEMELLTAEERTNYPLVISVDDLGDDFAVTAQVSATVGAERVWSFMRTALEALVFALDHEPQRPICRIDVLPAAERERIVVEWNATERDYPHQSCAHQLFEAQVERAPDAVAIEQGSEWLSYAELDARANRLAHYLRRLGVRADRRVAICLDRSLALVTVMLATGKAGGAYVPLDPAHPAERLETLLRGAGPVVVVTGGRAAPAIAPVAARCDVPVIDLGNDDAWRDEDPERPETPELMANHLAYVIYTSGSTGQPKGVMVEHRSLTNLVTWHIEAFGLSPGSCSSSTAGVGFDATTWEIWPPLSSGGTLVLPPSAVAGDPQDLLAWWRAQPLDISFLVTPLAELTHATAGSNPHLQTLLIGGDRLRRWPDGLPAGQALINNYGPTESCVVATSGRLSGDDPVLHIGRPIANTRVYLVDEAMRPVPVGVAGELVIGGAGVARGYLNQPELTAERFVADPFVPGGRLYRTGDLARWRADGTIEYLGRNDFQVKIRGYRIELGEIEARLGEVDGVDEVVVIARDEGAGAQRLAAYYTGAASGASIVEALRGHAARTLPGYMVPSAYVRLAALPLTANGKLDRRALPAPDAAPGAPGPGGDAPRGELEQIVAGLWSELLGCERVGRHDNFFALGGHSLLAVQLVSRLRRVLGVELTVSELFEHPELDRLAARVSGAARSALPEIPVAERTGPAPLSLAQQRLWFLSRLPGASAAYHIGGTVRLDGALDRGALVRALARIVERHEALRTCFQVIDGQPMQVVQAKTLALEDHDVRGADDADAAARQLGEAHAAAAFDLAREAPLRVQLVRVADEAHVLQVVMHHIASDGWSVGAPARRAEPAVRGVRDRAGTTRCRRRRCSTPTCAVWQRSYLASGALASQAEFWRNTLAGAPPQLSLPRDRPRPAQQDHAAASIPVELDAALAKALRALSQRHGATMYMTLLGELGGGAVAAGRAGRRRHRQPGGGAAARGARGGDGLLRQHAGAAHRPRGRSDGGRAAGADAGAGAGGARAPGPAVRAGGGGGQAGAQPLRTPHCSRSCSTGTTRRSDRCACRASR